MRSGVLKLERARLFRREGTKAEALLWEHLRRQRPRFRRQALVRGFIVDFHAPRARLVVEIDGGVHGECEQLAYDDARDRILAAAGQHVVRVSNERILDDVADVAGFLITLARARSSPRVDNDAAGGPPPLQVCAAGEGVARSAGGEGTTPSRGSD